MASKHGVYGASLTGDWARLGTALAHLSARFPQAMESALHEEGEFYRKKMVEGIREQAPGGQRFRPLSPVTIALRKLMGFGGTKALLRSGELRNHIVSVPGQGFVFVGILYTARGEDGRNLADIGRLNEYGGTVRATISKARMRLIAAALRKTRGRSGGSGGGGIGMVHIPARPFIRPVIAEYGQRRGAERYMARVARKVGGLLGVMNHPDLKGFGVERLPERLAGGKSGGMAKGLRSMRRGGSMKSARKRKPFDYKKAMAAGMFKAGRGRGVRLKSRPIAERKPKIIRPRLPKPKQAKMPKRSKAPAAPRRTVKGRPFKPIKTKKPRAPKPVDPKKVAQREARGFEARMRQVQKQLDKGRAAIQRQRAAEARAAVRQVEAAKRAADRAQQKAQRDQARAQKQAEKQYLRDNPQHNAHVRHRQMRINLGHLSE